MMYPGVTRLQAGVAHRLAGRVSVTLTGSNLLNYQQGEPDNLTVVPGRTITLGASLLTR